MIGLSNLQVMDGPTMTTTNAKAGFLGAGLIPYNPQVVLSKLDIRLQTPTQPVLISTNFNSWVSQTPQNPTEALSQTTLVKNHIANHQGSSPTSIFLTVKALAKGTERLAHENTLLIAENYTLRKANMALSKRRRAKRTRLQQGGVLTTEEATDILSRKEVGEQIIQNKSVESGKQSKGQLAPRCCGTCGKTGHNSRTCQEVKEAII